MKEITTQKEFDKFKAIRTASGNSARQDYKMSDTMPMLKYQIAMNSMTRESDMKLFDQQSGKSVNIIPNNKSKQGDHDYWMDLQNRIAEFYDRAFLGVDRNPVNTGSALGVSDDNTVYYKPAGSSPWQPMGTLKLKNIDISTDGSHIWGIAPDDAIYYRNGINGSWTRIPGALKQVSTSSDGSAWGANRNDYVYTRVTHTGGWSYVGPHNMKQIDVSDNNSHIYAIRTDDAIYYKAGRNGSWQNISGKLKQVSVSNDGSAWGVNSTNMVYYKTLNGSWQGIDHRIFDMKQVSVSDDGLHVWGVNDANKIFYRAGRNGSWTEVPGTNFKWVCAM